VSAGKPGDDLSTRSVNRRRTISPVRALAITTGAIFFADIVAMGVLEVLKVRAFFAMTMLDAVIMAALVFPILFGLAFRPMMRLIHTQATTERELAQVNVELRTRIAERQQAQEALQRYAETQAALYAVAVAATHQLDVERLTARVTEVVLTLFGADAGWVLFPGESPADKPRVAFSRQTPETLIAAECSQPLAECQTCGPWFRDGFPPTVSPIVSSCPRLAQEVLTAAGFASHVGIMLRAGTRVVGTLNLAWRVPHAHSETEQSLLVTIAGQVGFALENALLYRAEQRARKTAEALRTASLAVTQTLDLENVLETLLENLRLLVPYDRARVMLLEGASRLRVQAALVNGKALFLRERPITFDPNANPVIQSVLTTLRGTLIPDIHAHPQWGARMRPEFERSWMGVPLVSGGKAIGLYSLSKKDPASFSEEDLRLAEALSAPASVAIHNAALFKQVLAGSERLQTLSRQLVGLQEDERRRVSRELHDEAGQAITSLLFTLRLLEREAAAGGAVTARTEDLRRIADGIQETLHRVATDLRPVALDQLGLVPALGQLVEELSNQGGPNIVVEALGLGEDRLPPDAETALYRIAQEAVTNAVRHAGAREIAVVLERRDSHLVMIVEDDGEGFDADLTLGPGHLGMVGMRERAEMLGGTLLVESSPGSGTTVVVEVPFGR
jgi:signal transduction histidine kinase